MLPFTTTSRKSRRLTKLFWKGLRVLRAFVVKFVPVGFWVELRIPTLNSLADKLFPILRKTSKIRNNNNLSTGVSCIYLRGKCTLYTR